MNCRSFQSKIFDYLDDTLAPWSKAAAQKHLTSCPHCRRALEKERQLARVLNQQFVKMTQGRSLAPEVLRRIQTISESGVGPKNHPLLQFASATSSLFRGWRIAAAAFAAVVVLLVGTALLTKHSTRPASPSVARIENTTNSAQPSVSVAVSYPVRTYIFRQEGNFVIDALCYNTNVVRQTLFVEK